MEFNIYLTVSGVEIKHKWQLNISPLGKLYTQGNLLGGALFHRRAWFIVWNASMKISALISNLSMNGKSAREEKKQAETFRFVKVESLKISDIYRG